MDAVNPTNNVAISAIRQAKIGSGHFNELLAEFSPYQAWCSFLRGQAPYFKIA